MNAEQYIGDAVYISDDGFQLKLRCEAPSEHGVIYLEPPVFAELIKYAIERGYM